MRSPAPAAWTISSRGPRRHHHGLHLPTGGPAVRVLPAKGIIKPSSLVLTRSHAPSRQQPRPVHRLPGRRAPIHLCSHHIFLAPSTAPGPYARPLPLTACSLHTRLWLSALSGRSPSGTAQSLPLFTQAVSTSRQPFVLRRPRPPAMPSHSISCSTLVHTAGMAYDQRVCGAHPGTDSGRLSAQQALFPAVLGHQWRRYERLDDFVRISTEGVRVRLHMPLPR